MTAIEHFRETVQLDSGLIIPASAAAGKVLTSDAAGVGTWQLPSALSTAIAYRNAALKAAKEAFTSIAVDTIVKDVGGNISGGTYVVPAEGYYVVAGNVAFSLAAENLSVIASIYVNGTENKRVARFVEKTAGAVNIPIMGLVFCKTGDKIEIRGWQSGAECSFEIGSQQNRLEVARLGEGPEGKENSLVANSIAIGYRAAAQKMAAAGYTKVAIDTAVKDPGGNLKTASGYYVAPADGYYHVNGQVSLASTISTKVTYIASIFVTGAEKLRGSRIVPSENTNLDIEVNGIVFCKAGDFIELFLFNGGAELSLEVGEGLNRLTVTRLGSGPAGAQGIQGPAGEGLGVAGTAPALLYRSAAQSVAAGPVKVKLDTALFDPGAHFTSASNCYTAPAAGYYQVNAQVEIEYGTAAAIFLGCSIVVNNSTRITGSQSETGTTAPTENVLSATAGGLIHLEAGDKVELFINQNSAAKTAHNLISSSGSNFLSVARVA